MTDTTADVAFFELRRAPEGDPHPLVLGRYLDLADAIAHGEDDFTNEYGMADRLAWYPDDDTETVHHLHATDLDDEVQTEWHIVAGTIAATYKPDDDA